MTSKFTYWRNPWLLLAAMYFITAVTIWRSPNAASQVTPEPTIWLQAGDRIQILGADQKQLGGEQRTYSVRRRLPDHWVEVETPEKQTAYLNLGQSLLINKVSSQKSE
jgi:hypothetical protein